MSGDPGVDDGPSEPPELTSRPARVHIPGLDGMRAASFMIVFLGHAGLGDIVPGGFGVTIFFFLSGYLITTLLRLELESTQKVNFGHFYLRRILRIFPSYYIVLFVTIGLTAAGILGGGLEPGHELSQLFYYNNFWQIAFGPQGQPDGTGVYWSLAVEEHFYLVFPAVLLGLAGFARTGRARAAALMAACAVVLAWRCVLVFGLDASIERTYYATDTRIDSILFGCILALWHNPVLDPPLPRRQLWPALAMALATLLGCLVVRDDAFRETLRYSLQGMALIPVFMVVILFTDRPVVRWLEIGWVRWMGRLSYGAYLVHFVIIELLLAHTGMAAVPRGVIALVLTFAFAELLQRGVDQPMARVRARYR